jgi:hypothetical protein
VIHGRVSVLRSPTAVVLVVAVVLSCLDLGVVVLVAIVALFRVADVGSGDGLGMHRLALTTLPIGKHVAFQRRHRLREVQVQAQSSRSRVLRKRVVAGTGHTNVVHAVRLSNAWEVELT